MRKLGYTNISRGLNQSHIICYKKLKSETEAATEKAIEESTRRRHETVWHEYKACLKQTLLLNNTYIVHIKKTQQINKMRKLGDTNQRRALLVTHNGVLLNITCDKVQQLLLIVIVHTAHYIPKRFDQHMITMIAIIISRRLM